MRRLPPPRRLGAMLFVCLILHSALTWASDSQAERVTLTGLPAISIVVEGLPGVAEKSGLTETALEQSIQARLRQAGITVTSDADAYLYLQLTVAAPTVAAPLGYALTLSLMQEVTLPRGVRSRTPIQCPTWWLNTVGLASADGLNKAVRARTDEFVGAFIKAYQEVNPK
jgi:hypothetical protein